MFVCACMYVCVCVCRQSWVEEKEVLCGRIEECEMTMKSSSQQLEEARREMKKVRPWDG